MDLIEILKSIDYLPEKFVYRWINNILSREFSIQQLIKIWDRILGEEQEVSNCLGYVGAALLLMFSKDLKNLAETPDEIIMYLQDLPTYKWKDEDIKILMAEGYQLKTYYQNNKHLSLMGDKISNA